MCDYSLAGLSNRLAADGEELVVHRFPTHSIGLASPADLREPAGYRSPQQTVWQRITNAFHQLFDSPEVPAVCIPPGACLILKNIPLDLQRRWDAGEEEGVYFVQTSAEVNAYRDALQFRDGRQVLLQDLREGMVVKVVSLDRESIGSEEPALVIQRG
jgi:hypothetical protein